MDLEPEVAPLVNLSDARERKKRKTPERDGGLVEIARMILEHAESLEKQVDVLARTVDALAKYTWNLDTRVDGQFACSQRQEARLRALEASR